jgi:hypothetical protein
LFETDHLPQLVTPAQLGIRDKTRACFECGFCRFHNAALFSQMMLDRPDLNDYTQFHEMC